MADGGALSGFLGVSHSLTGRRWRERPADPAVTRDHQARHIVITKWNGGPVAAGEGRALLKDLGFQNLPGGMAWWPAP